MGQTLKQAILILMLAGGLTLAAGGLILRRQAAQNKIR